MLPPHGPPHRRPPTPSESPSLGFSIIFTLLLTHGCRTGATTSFPTQAFIPVVTILLPWGFLPPFSPSLTQAFIPVVIILPVDWDFLTVVPSSPSGLGLHPWVLYPYHAIGGFYRARQASTPLTAALRPLLGWTRLSLVARGFSGSGG
ncbi:hypothetical protein BJY52DRAFT_1199058 [Lactarius psammicola]|nr:hypothetical protein BJY52DRAFT_1199058 [Lactarius psammicola]